MKVDEFIKKERERRKKDYILPEYKPIDIKFNCNCEKCKKTQYHTK